MGVQLLGMTFAQYRDAVRAGGGPPAGACAEVYRAVLGDGRRGRCDPQPPLEDPPLRWTAAQGDPEALKLTGRMGLIRHLEAAEIVAQVYLARRHVGLAVRNVVFMGMGEPLDNPEAVVQAIEVLSDQRGFDIPRRRITLSTVGLEAGLARLGRLPAPGVRLAVSLNAPDDPLRSLLMPVNRGFPLRRLVGALRAYPLGPREQVMIGYVLIGGLNDTPEHARELTRLLAPLRVKVNLIPLNPGGDPRWAAPAPETVAAFQRALMSQGVQVWRRTPRGQGLMAACGQLATAGPRTAAAG